MDTENVSPSENNLDDWLESIVNNVPNSNPTTAPFGYAYDKVGNRLARDDGTTTHTYDYDNIYQLLSDTIGLNNVLTLAYDAVGSRTQTTAYQNPPLTYLTTSNELNQYDQVGIALYLYDDNGNLAGIDTNGDSTYEIYYVYDEENRLVEALTPTDYIVYQYEAQGRRITKIVGTTTTRYVYDGDQIVAEYVNGYLIREYIYGPGIDEPICMIDWYTEDLLYFYHLDALGNVAALSNMSGQIVERYAYDAFGKCTVHTGAGADLTWMTADDTLSTQSARNNPFLFTGRQYDPETGLYYYRARMYSPSLGRFLQTDPIGYADSMNLYGYCGNNPTTFVDPMGLKIEFDDTVSWTDRRAYNRAIKQLSKSTLFRNTYDYLKRKDTPVVTIGFQTEDGSFHTEMGVNRDSGSYISWNRIRTLSTYRGQQSAILSLAHEMEHARIHMIGGIWEGRNEWKIKPTEEEYIVDWFESPIAQELGEPYREDYMEPYRIEKKCNKN